MLVFDMINACALMVAMPRVYSSSLVCNWAHWHTYKIALAYVFKLHLF